MAYKKKSKTVRVWVTLNKQGIEQYKTSDVFRISIHQQLIRTLRCDDRSKGYEIDKTSYELEEQEFGGKVTLTAFMKLCE